MKILIFGASGQLGSTLLRLVQGTSYEVLGLRHSDTWGDITTEENVAQAIKTFVPDIIFNASAYTNVDLAEKEVQKAFLVNAKALQWIGEYAKAVNALVVHFSTDYVFDGQKKTPYTEKDSPCPINQYGKSKLEGERLLAENGGDFLIFRLSSVYASHHNNCVTKIMQWLQNNEKVQVVEDQFITPTFVDNIAQGALKAALLTLRNKSLTGIYHLTDAGPFLSRFSLAQFILEEMKKKDKVNIKAKELLPVSSDKFVLPAKRPVMGALAPSLFIEKFSFPLKSWQENVRQVIHDSYSD